MFSGQRCVVACVVAWANVARTSPNIGEPRPYCVRDAHVKVGFVNVESVGFESFIFLNRSAKVFE